jgi:hypothetical protein
VQRQQLPALPYHDPARARVGILCTSVSRELVRPARCTCAAAGPFRSTTDSDARCRNVDKTNVEHSATVVQYSVSVDRRRGHGDRVIQVVPDRVQVPRSCMQRHLVLAADLAHNGVERSVMTVTHGRKQVMLHLKVEAARHDIAEDAVCPEILRRHDLMPPEVCRGGVRRVRRQVVDLSSQTRQLPDPPNPHTCPYY